MSEIASGVSILTELDPASAAKVSSALTMAEIDPASAARASGVLILVELLGPQTPTGIVDVTLHSRSTAATMRTKRKTYTTINDRTAALTLEDRP